MALCFAFLASIDIKTINKLLLVKQALIKLLG